MGEMTVIQWVFYGGSILGAVVITWILRHSVLKRQLTQTRGRLKAIESEQRLEKGELATLRPKLIQQEALQAEISKWRLEAKKAVQDLETFMAEYDDVKGKGSEIEREREDLLDQLGFLDAEKVSWQQNETKLQESNDILKEEVKQLLYQVEDLKARLEKAGIQKSMTDKSQKKAAQKGDREAIPPNPDKQKLEEQRIAQRMMRDRVKPDPVTRNVTDKFGTRERISTDKFVARDGNDQSDQSLVSQPLAETPITGIPARPGAVESESAEPIAAEAPDTDASPDSKKKKRKKGKGKSTGILLLEAIEEEALFPKQNP